MDDITTGIWTVHAEEPDGDGAEVWAVQANGGRRHVASHICDADAVLISAAPELLAALRKAVSLLSYAAQGGGLAGCNADEWFAIESDLNSAINKAEGIGD
jgi:hypothetical protein